jgi:hypothetical protein
MAEFIASGLALSPLTYLAILFALLGVGFAITVFSVREKGSRREEIFAFRELFIDWVNGRFRDQQTYMQLISASPKVQDAMGHWGIYGTFIPPYSQVSYRNWPIILNGIPAINQHTSDPLMVGRIAGGYVDVVDEALLRALGTLEANIKEQVKGLRNPVILLREGLVYTLTLPFYVLAEFGLLTRRAYERIVSSVIVRAVAFGAAAFGLFASAVGVTVDWEPFVAKLAQFRQWLGI